MSERESERCPVILLYIHKYIIQARSMLILKASHKLIKGQVIKLAGAGWFKNSTGAQECLCADKVDRRGDFTYG